MANCHGMKGSRKKQLCVQFIPKLSIKSNRKSNTKSQNSCDFNNLYAQIVFALDFTCCANYNYFINMYSVDLI